MWTRCDGGRCVTRVVIIGAGPAGYEAALVAVGCGADVTVVGDETPGGGCVLHDCVPSKTFIASATTGAFLHRAADLGVRLDQDRIGVDVAGLHQRVRALALAQAQDVRARLRREGVQLISGTGALADEAPGRAVHRVVVTPHPASGTTDLPADVVLIASGATPRILPAAQPDGQRILTWRQIYDLEELPSALVVVGSGVTGAEFVSAYADLRVPVTLVSSRDRVLPGEDADAAAVLEEVFAEQGVHIVKQARAQRVARTADGVVVHLVDGRTVAGSHALMTVGSVPRTDGLGLPTAGVRTDDGGYIVVDRVSRTSAPGVYAAGDCTGLLPLASVAAMQGRISMWHALGRSVTPIRRRTVAAAVFTNPEIATVGVSQHAVDSGQVAARTVTLPLATNARAKMQGLRQGFVKLFCRPVTGVVVGGVIVAPLASELILPIALAVRNALPVDDLAQTFSVYPSLSGSITEAARQLMCHDDLD